MTVLRLRLERARRQGKRTKSANHKAYGVFTFPTAPKVSMERIAPKAEGSKRVKKPRSIY